MSIITLARLGSEFLDNYRELNRGGCEVGIVQTRIWLKRLFDKNAYGSGNEIPPFKKLMNHFPSWTQEEWLLFLQHNGLLSISEEAKKKWVNWQKAHPSKGLTQLYTEIKDKFQGPDVDVFLFPINEENDFLMDVMNGKNGITFPSFILLFFHQQLTSKEKQALLIHEYHHASRLHHTKNKEETVTLLESFLMEGLAELEVKRILGEKYVTPWMELYSEEELLSWWNRGIKNKIKMQGRQQHAPFLYGGIYGYPQWLGYSIGYRMARSYMEAKTAKMNYPPSSIELLKTSANDIYEGSIFFEGKGQGKS